MAKPFLKWAGGKRALSAEIMKRMPESIDAYVEPFVGGGAVFFALYNAGRFAKDAQIRLSDIDRRLIGIWRTVRDDPEGLIVACQRLTKLRDDAVALAVDSQGPDCSASISFAMRQKGRVLPEGLKAWRGARCDRAGVLGRLGDVQRLDDAVVPGARDGRRRDAEDASKDSKRAVQMAAARKVFNWVRNLSGGGLEPITDTAQAARLLWLNRQCFNGLWRFNAKGQFNAPWGKSPARTCVDADNIRACSAALRGVKLMVADFVDAITSAPEGCVGFLDPPYAEVRKASDGGSFTRYGAVGPFGEPQQRAVAAMVDRVTRSGRFSLIVASNSDCALTREIWCDSVHRDVDVVYARRSINSSGTGRGPVPELLITQPARMGGA